MKAVLVSDYLKGCITRSVVQTLLNIGVPLLVDPKIPHLACYAGATLVTPNSHEAEVATHMRIRNADEARAAGARVSLSRTVRVSIDHARRTWDVALG